MLFWKIFWPIVIALTALYVNKWHRTDDKILRMWINIVLVALAIGWGSLFGN